MRTVVLLVVWLVSIHSVSATPIKVVTWNLQWYPGGKPKADEPAKKAQITAAKQAIKRLNPDVLLLQEVADWSAAVDLCSVVPGLKVAVTSLFGTYPQNQVVALKLPVDSGWFAPWKYDAAGTPPRGYAFAAIKLPNNKYLLTYSLHLKANGGGIEKNTPAREISARQILAHIKEMEAIYGKRGKCDVLLGGDFNTSKVKDDPRFAGDHTIALIEAGGLKWVFEKIPFRTRITIPASGPYPDNTFDHIFYSGLILRSVSVGKGQPVSDHNPVVATFEP